MNDYRELDQLFKDRGYSDYKWIKADSIVVSQWVRNKCIYGCGSYGQKGSCPPNNPSVPECREFFGDYSNVALFHFEKRLEDPEARHKWSKGVSKKLLKLEREVFLRGYYKAFLLVMDECNLCKECGKSRENCKNPKLSRPSPEGMAVDVFATVRHAGLPIEVVRDYQQKMDRYAFLLVE